MTLAHKVRFRLTSDKIAPESRSQIHWLLITETSLAGGFQNPDRQRAISSASSLLSVLAQCPGEEVYDTDVILMSI